MSVTYIDAIHDAQKDLLAEDKDVFLYGQDIGVFGGAFKATKGLKELFPDRVIDAPISEDAMAGMVTGAAVMGKKPIMEVQFADFSTIAFNQINYTLSFCPVFYLSLVSFLFILKRYTMNMPCMDAMKTTTFPFLISHSILVKTPIIMMKWTETLLYIIQARMNIHTNPIPGKF